MIQKSIFLLIFIITANFALAQVLTKEDSLNAGLIASNNTTVISGYGEAKVEYDTRLKTGTANLTRNVLFIGHKFSNKISFFSEMELESAKIVGGKPSGEISMEQLFLKFNINRNNYITAGLFIPRFGIINENHLPTTFNSNDRHYTEQLIIPATWRELGIGVYGIIPSVPGLNYSASLTNGLNSAGFVQGTGIREGRFEGSNATASNLALTGSLLHYFRNFRIQTSMYFGGSAGVTQKVGDSLNLDYGAFGTPVLMNEFNVQYNGPKGLQFKALGVISTIKDADRINAAYASNTAEQMFGYYAEIGYDIFKLFPKLKKKKLVVYARYENMDLNAKLARNGVNDDFLKKQFLIAGVHFQPISGVSIKIDYVHRTTGQYNPVLYVSNPYAVNNSVYNFYKTSGFVNIGIAYSF